MTKQYIYGIDIGGSKIELAVFDASLKQLESWRIATPQTSYQDFLTALVEMISSADHKYQCCGAVGIGMPGIINANQEVLSANVPHATGQNAAQDLAKLINRPVAIENDCRCFALSEAKSTIGLQHTRVFGAIIGTGAGGGLCIDGELYKSAQGIAGEYGHYSLSAVLQQKYQLPILKCGCGLTGCVESYIAGPGLARIHWHFSGKELTTFEIVEGLRKGDVFCQQSFACYLDLMGSTFAAIIMAYDPEVIVIGGGMSLVNELVSNLEEAIVPYVFADIRVPKIVLAEFGDASGARGAAILAKAQVGVLS
ncbi:N-acetylglucosamine kinase [Pseudoalteromonas porphyrae]|uniref:ROK family protein n=1 Tax=Pseudoalteromonas TaxID=53246 RepID=UPI0006BB119C|nr:MULTISPECIES: ROK family protein [Pseudoalteromonas]KPH94492.1 N-acetylglucosamine kinase [Pseudoalteromonas porphyrae]NMR24620.1 ROK family protein [Pseudoalteromonas sp. NEC-BIFX-2020_015]